MAYINENYLKLPGSYLFSDIAKRVDAFKKEEPSSDIIRLGIGDVTLPLPQVAIQAMQKAVEEMSDAKTFRGYGPEQGYDFLRSAIVEDFKGRGIDLKISEIFISDGSKSDCANIQEIFSYESKIAITDPVYPVYLDSNVMAGRTGDLASDGHFADVSYLASTKENNFSPELPREHVDIIYLCSPNNPTGTALTRRELKKWVDYAKSEKALILFDAAYVAYITEDDIPRTIYEVEGAKEVAIEFHSFSKTAGFTGTRCAYTIVPEALVGFTKKGKACSLNEMWNRRQSTKFNGTAYIIQRGAASLYTKEGKEQTAKLISYYLMNAKIIREGLTSIGINSFGGVNSPYIWLEVPHHLSSWDFFDKLLKTAHIVGTPGVGFGPCGEGYFRLTAFNTRENTERAIKRLEDLKI